MRAFRVTAARACFSVHSGIPRIVTAARKRGTPTRVQISDNRHHASTRTVCVVGVVPMADSRSERLHVLLTASSNLHRLIDVSGLSKA